MSIETILIIGGSFAGIGAAHYACKHVIPQLPKKEGVTYNVTLVNPSKDLFWRFAAPRACASKQMMPPNRIFYPIEPAFTYAYPRFKFVQGTATRIDPAGQSVSVRTTVGEEQTIPYAALVVATGFTTPSPLFTQRTDATEIEAIYKLFQERLKNAATIVIGGGGPVGVETAGEIAEIMNGRQSFFASVPNQSKAKVRLICGDGKLLPILRPQIAEQAQRYLKELGCDVTYNTRIVRTTREDDTEGAITRVELSNGEIITADVYVDCTGIRPNTGFLPSEWLDNRKKLACNPKTLRVDHESAGSHVYAVGDVASYARGGVMDMYDAIPVAMTNLRTNLTACLSGVAPVGDRLYKPNLREQQLCPVGTQKGVGAFDGFRLPSQIVWLIKGRNYLLSFADSTLRGDRFRKVSKWKQVQQTRLTGLKSD